jgi:hypothetical protein
MPTTDDCSAFARCVCVAALMLLILADYAACCYFDERLAATWTYSYSYPKIDLLAAQLGVFGGGLLLAGLMLLAAAKILPVVR